MPLNPRRSLRSRLGLAIAATTLILSLLTSVIVGHTVSAQLRIHVGEDLADLAHQMADKLDRGMFERYRDLQILSTLAPIRQPNTPETEVRSLLEKLQSTYTDYAWIGLTDAQGVVVASTGKLLEGRNLAERPWFISGKNAPYIGDVHDAVKLAKLLPNPDGEPIRFVDIAVPIEDLQGNFKGVLAAHLSWKWSKEVQRSLLREHSHAEVALSEHHHAQMFIFSQAGDLLMSPPKIEAQPRSLQQIIRTRQAGYSLEAWTDDSDRYITGFARSTGYRTYPGLGWSILVRQKIDTAFAPARQLEKYIFAWNAALGVGCAILGWWVAARLTNPLLEITAAAESIRQGNATVQIPIQQGKDEIAKLSRSLSRLVSTLTLAENDLKESNQRLQLELAERHRVEESLRLSEEKFRQLAENIKEVFWIASPELDEIVYVSPAYELLWQRNSEGLAVNPQSWLEAVHPQDREGVIQALIQTARAEFNLEYRLVQPSGEVRWIWDRTFPIRNEGGEIYRRARLTQDITERKQADATRKALEQEKEVNELKSRFVSMTSHEFRTPLGTILSSAELLERYHQKWAVDKQVQHLHRIQIAVKHMTEMLNNVLTLGKVEAGKLQLQPAPLNVAKFCHDLVEEVQAKVGQRIIFKGDAAVLSAESQPELDEKLLRHILSNLLTNAIKYSPEDCSIEFGVRCWGDRIIFSIQDFGIGIPVEDQKHLFESFYRASNVGNIQGTGLGLAIVKKCVDLHRGEITVSSQVGLGTTFTVTLPSH